MEILLVTMAAGYVFQTHTQQHTSLFVLFSKLVPTLGCFYLCDVGPMALRCFSAGGATEEEEVEPVETTVLLAVTAAAAALLLLLLVLLLPLLVVLLLLPVTL
jgi:hypothetical protein